MAPASKGALLNIHYYYCYTHAFILFSIWPDLELSPLPLISGVIIQSGLGY